MKRLIIGFSLGCLCSTVGWTQATQPSTPSPSADQSAKRVEIRKLIDLTGAANVSADALRQIIAPLKAAYPDVPQEFWDNFTKEVRSDELVDLVVPIYDKYYTRDEIHELTVFYQSPVGQKTIKVLPQLSAEAITAGQQWGQMVADRAMRKLKDKGYDKSSQLFVIPSAASVRSGGQDASEESVLSSGPVVY